VITDKGNLVVEHVVNAGGLWAREVGRMVGIEIPVLAMGISSDVLYPAYQSREIVAAVNAAGGDAEYAELDSPHGHDAFLLEFDQVGETLTKFLNRIENDG